MNLPLHYGWLGSLEAGAIGFFAGLLVFALWQRGCRRAGLSHGYALGWGCLIATAIAAGWDAWNLFYTSIVRLESPLYARLALAGIHDPDELGSRVVLEVTGAFAGVAIGGWLFIARSEKKTSSED